VRGCAPVRFGDVVFQILKADAPQAPSADLNGAKLTCLQQCPDLAVGHVEFLGCLLDGQESVLLGFFGHRFILCAGHPAGSMNK
jgi:hypothetical protein